MKRSVLGSLKKSIGSMAHTVGYLGKYEGEIKCTQRVFFIFSRTIPSMNHCSIFCLFLNLWVSSILSAREVLHASDGALDPSINCQSGGISPSPLRPSND